MNKDLIKHIHLKSLHINVCQDASILTVEKAEAKMNVSFHFKEPIKSIAYRILVGENEDNLLFVMKCEYTFQCNQKMDDQELLDCIVKTLQSRIEELMSLITIETGYIDL